MGHRGPIAKQKGAVHSGLSDQYKVFEADEEITSRVL